MTARPGKLPLLLAAALLAVGIAGAGALYMLVIEGEEPQDAAQAPAATSDIATLPASEASVRAIDLAQWSLSELHRGFDAGSDAEIRAALAPLAAPDAIEAAFAPGTAERLAENGLSSPSRGVHEVEFVTLSARSAGARLSIEGSWRVLGLIDPERHVHMKGTLYEGAVTLERGSDAWRITDVSITGADSAGAGEISE